MIEGVRLKRVSVFNERMTARDCVVKDSLDTFVTSCLRLRYEAIEGGEQSKLA